VQDKDVISPGHHHQQQHPFNGLLSRTTRVSQYQQGKISLDLLEQEIVSGSGISWAICRSAPRSRQITMPASRYSVFTGRMPFLPPNHRHQSTEDKTTEGKFYWPPNSNNSNDHECLYCKPLQVGFMCNTMGSTHRIVWVPQRWMSFLFV